MKRAITIAAMLAAAGLAGAQMFAQLFGMTSTARLPAEYQEVEYLASTNGLAYLNVSVGFLTTSSRYRIKYRMLGVFAGQNNGIYGSSLANRYCAFVPSGGSTLRTQYAGGVLDKTFSQTSSIVDLFQDSNTAILNIDGTVTTNEISGVGAHNYDDFRLFSIAGFNSNSKIAVYCFQFWTGATLQRNYVPCSRKSDGVLGMYDLVGNTFETNDGTGSFTAGPDVD